MGLLSTKSRDRGLPLYHRVDSGSKEAYSADEYSSDDDSAQSLSAYSSPGSSRNTSASLNSGLLAPPKAAKPPSRRIANLYPYRLPSRVTRYLLFGAIGFIALMILSLVRASQVENWKVQNGEISHNRPAETAHTWEKFRFLERYYGGIRTLVPLAENKPEYPTAEEEPELLEELKQEVEQDHEEADVEDLEELEAKTDLTAGIKEGEPEDLEYEEEEEEEEEEEGEEELEGEGGDGDRWEDYDDYDDTAAKSKRVVPASRKWTDYRGKNAANGAKECFIDAAGTIRVPEIRYYNGRPRGFPQNVAGSYEVLGLPEDICFERYGRYGPYGFGYSLRNGGLGTGEHGESEGASEVWSATPRVDYRKVDWADVQRRCYKTNSQRFKAFPPRTPLPHGFYADQPSSKTRRDTLGNETELVTPTSAAADAAAAVPTETNAVAKGPKKVSKAGKSRTAVVIRCWDEYLFREDDFTSLRSLIVELSMASGGAYDVHLLVQVKDDARYAIWADSEVYEQRIKDVIPKEFQGLVTLWSETQMLALYQGIHDNWARGPDLPVHGVYRGLSMAMQYFAYMHPEYDYFWQWEMDIRYVGHHLDLFTKLGDWAKKQPRKGLWERNSRFYFPSAHGSWSDFVQMSRIQSEMGTVGADNIWSKVNHKEPKAPENAAKGDKTVWGPQRTLDENDWLDPENDTAPPTTYDRDRYKWGVGEEADYISLSPMFDPEGTTWGLKDDITGYNKDAGAIPRRAHIITASRMSRKLLMTMHRMTYIKKQFAFPEMWPATVALQHGMKAVYAPHPLYVDREWPVEYMAQTYNNGKSGSSGGSRTSVFGDREHNLWGISWFYNSGFAPNLYRRWLGLRVDNEGGEEFEKTQDKSRQASGATNMTGGEGRMCMPPMLLHPVKGVELPVEAPPEEKQEVPVSDPSA